MIDAIEYAAELVLVRSREAVTERNVTVRRYAHEPEPRAARIRFTHPLVNFFEGVAHVRESMAAFCKCRLEKLGGERLETAKQLLKSLVLDGVLALPRRRHRRESDLPEAKLLIEMPVDGHDVEIL